MTALVESVGPGRSEDILATLRWGAMRERELEALREQLLDIRSSDIVGLCDLHHLEDLHMPLSVISSLEQA